MRANKRTQKSCYYCNALISAYHVEEDHFPIPEKMGGIDTVPCCISCHDMKDRFRLEYWPKEWIDKVVEDFPKLNRETKIFLAKSIRIISQFTENAK